MAAFLIGVVGSGNAAPEILTLAESVGKAIVERGHILVTGGQPAGGPNVKDKAMDGALTAPGPVGLISILPKGIAGVTVDTRQSVRRVVLQTGMSSNQRNLLTGGFPNALIAIGGAAGTASECAYALDAEIPVIFLNAWESLQACDLFFTGRARTVEQVLRDILPLSTARHLTQQLGDFLSSGLFVNWDGEVQPVQTQRIECDASTSHCQEAADAAVAAALDFLDPERLGAPRLTMLIRYFSQPDQLPFDNRKLFQNLVDPAVQFDQAVDSLISFVAAENEPKS